MTDKEIYQLIEENKAETDALYERIHEQVESSIVQHAAFKKKRQKLLTRVFSAVAAVVLVLSLAIVLPIVLRQDATTPDGEPVIWYSDTDLTSTFLEDNLKAYARKNNDSFLYIDLYDIAEELKTYRFYENDNESITAYLQETFTHGEYGYFVQFTVMKSNISVKSFDEKMKEPLEISVNNVDVYYEIGRSRSLAQFEYNNYKYYLEIKDEIDEIFLTEIISNMFESQQATA